jgi:hypothetical protein
MIRAELLNPRTATACGVTARGDAPLFELARRLIDVGHVPSEPLALIMNGAEVIRTTLGAAAKLGQRISPSVAMAVELQSSARSASRALMHARTPTSDADRRGRTP